MSDGLELRTGTDVFRHWMTALRPAHWVKNLLVAAPMVFGHATLTPSLVVSLVAAFVVCCLAASAGYLVNDVHDRGSDRIHTSKRSRPVTLGLIDPRQAMGVALVLAAAAIGLAYLISPAAGALIIGYLVMTTAYSRWLKQLPVIDVCVLALLFALRLQIGGVASDIVVSGWLFAFGCCLFLSLALAKRLDEVVTSDRARVPGRAYGPGDAAALTRGAILCGTAAIGVLVAYIWLRAGDIYVYRQPDWLWLSTALLAFWLAHMLRRAAGGRLHGDPVVVATSDPISLALAVAVAATIILAV